MPRHLRQAGAAHIAALDQPVGEDCAPLRHLQRVPRLEITLSHAIARSMLLVRRIVHRLSHEIVHSTISGSCEAANRDSSLAISKSCANSRFGQGAIALALAELCAKWHQSL